jgi:hypothetical protein
LFAGVDRERKVPVMSEFETIGLEPVESLTITTLGYSQDTPEMCNSPLRTGERTRDRRLLRNDWLLKETPETR